jgi:hypothetical protein
MEEYIIFRIGDPWQVYTDSVTGDPALTKDREAVLREIREQHPQEIRIVKLVRHAPIS